MHEAPTLSNDATDHSQLAQVIHSHMGDVRPRSVEVGPSQKASCPITLSGFVTGDELIVIDGPVCSIQSICASSATIVG